MERDDRVVGYGWLDDVWGDAEILMAVEEAARGTGAGAFALARLEEEAAGRGLNYVLNVVRDTHPDRAAVTGWFVAHGFTGTEDGRLRKQVGDRARESGSTRTAARNAGGPSRRTTAAGRGTTPSATGPPPGRGTRRRRQPTSARGTRRAAATSTWSSTGSERGVAVTGRGGMSR